MKRIIIFGLTILIAFVSFAQNDVTQFLGIPVDGTRTAMIQKLKAKGFTYNTQRDCMEGEFNGNDVFVYIVTYKNKVWRIMVMEKYSTTNEADIRIRFNNLCGQFRENEKYIPTNNLGEYEICESERISIQMSLYNKRYEASYYQITSDTVAAQEWLLERISTNYTDEERENMSEEEAQQALISLLSEYILEKFSKRRVWFMISEQYGQYSIIMYYDNELNHSNGEDL